MRKITLVVARILLIVVVLLSLLASPVLAMSNPNTIRFYAVGTTPVYKVFYNVSQTGDMLFIAEQFVHYTVSQNYTAGEAFLFEVLNTAGNVTIASTPLKEYEAKPISIYLTAAQVTAASISVGDALILRMMGNPLIFPSPVGNSVNVTLGVSSYFNQTLGVDGGVATNNLLRNFLINDIADDLQTYDSPPAGSE